MIHRTFFLITILLLPFGTVAQRHAKLLLKSGTTVLEPIIAWPPTEQPYQGYYFRLIQFDVLPNQAHKQELESAGVQLLEYIPHHAYFVAIQADRMISWKSFPHIQSVVNIHPDWKLDPAYHGESELLISYHRGLRADEIISELMAEGAEIMEQNDYVQLVAIKIAPERVQGLATQPYISFIEPLPPAPIEERQYFRSGSRANYLAEVYGFDGSGLTLAVAEGRAHPAMIDLHNRLDASLHPSSTSSGHGTAVAQFMAGAGNENPLYRGMAYGADVISYSYAIWDSAPSLYANRGLRLSNQSWGSGCNSGYNNDARAVDITVRNLPHFIMVFSTGNSQRSNCGYGAGHGWGTITGGVKTGKNVISVGALTRYDQVTGFSSFGPATDGRIKPDISTIGEGGTSFAAPTLSGVFAQLHQAYMSHHGGNEPPSGLIKAILQNTADDIGNPGPDFKHGYGKANARKAYRVIQEGTWQVDSILNAQQRTVSFSVPANTREVKVMVYWTDAPGAANAAKALVNDLDMSVIAPGGAGTWLPWVLDPTADSLTLDNDAIRAVDTLNNMEQVTLQNPAAGMWQVRVNGTEVPVGPQTFYVVTQVYQDELVLTYPLGGEGFVPSEQEIIRWDATGTGSFDLDYSMDGGLSWQQMATNIADSLRHYEWTVPSGLTGNVRVRIRSGNMQDTSGNFTIASLPSNLQMFWACDDSLKLVWDSVRLATGYRITALGAFYMDSIATTSTNEIILRNQSTTDTLWFAVQTLGPNQAVSRRTIAIRKNPGDFNCYKENAAAEVIISHPAGYLPNCQTGNMQPLGVRIKNEGVNAISNIPIHYRINGGPVTSGIVSQTIPSGNSTDFYFPGNINFSFAGTYNIQVWTDLIGDLQKGNDTTELLLTVYPSQSISLNYTQNFDTLTNCSPAWGCSDIDCPLGAGWFNVPNILGDSIDFRVHNGGTGSANTGPSNDHTQGNNNGKYIYLETSGNNGSGCRGQLAYLHSPCIDLANTSQASLSFWRHMYGASIGELHVDILSQGQWIEDVIAPVVGNQGDIWLQDSVDLSAFVGETIVIRFRATTGSGFTGDLALDDIQITTLPTSFFSADRLDVCPDDVVQFSDSSFYVDSREWQFSPKTINYVGGTSDTSAHPRLTFLQNGLYTVTLINTNTTGNDTLIKTTYINAGPHLLFLTTDDADNIICHGDSLTLLASSIAPTITFKELGNVLQSGPSDTLLIPHVSSNSIYTAVGTLYPGCLTDEPVVFITVNNPSISVSPMDSVAACEGDSILLNASGGFASYLWSNGINDQQIYAKSTGQYTVIGTDQAGCEAVSDSVWVDIFPHPSLLTAQGPSMTFIQSTDTFSVVGQAGSSFQWGSLGNASISSQADSAFITWQAVGIQSLWVLETTAQGCIGDTLFISVQVDEILGVDDVEAIPAYQIYPKPAHQEIFVDFGIMPQEVVSLMLFDMKGRLLTKIQGRQAHMRMELANFAEGMYMLNIQVGGRSVWEKVWVK